MCSKRGFGGLLGDPQLIFLIAGRLAVFLRSANWKQTRYLGRVMVCVSAGCGVLVRPGEMQDPRSRLFWRVSIPYIEDSDRRIHFVRQSLVLGKGLFFSVVHNREEKAWGCSSPLKRLHVSSDLQYLLRSLSVFRVPSDFGRTRDGNSRLAAYMKRPGGH